MNCHPRWFCRKLGIGVGERKAKRLCNEDVELLGEGGTGVEGVPRLVLAHHGNHLDATRDSSGTVRGLKPRMGWTRLLMRR